MLDSFFDLKMGHGMESTAAEAAATSSSSSSMKLKDGNFSIEVNTQDFDPEDLDICVETVAVKT